MKDLLKDKIVFFDFDGVLCTYQATKDKVHLPPEEYSKLHIGPDADPYKFSKAPKVLQPIVNRLDPKKVFVLSQMDNVFEYWNKIKFLKKFYPNILERNILFVAKSSMKPTLMEDLYKTYYEKEGMSRSDLVLVEDTISVISEAEDRGFTCYHITSFFE